MFGKEKDRRNDVLVFSVIATKEILWFFRRPTRELPDTEEAPLAFHPMSR